MTGAVILLLAAGAAVFLRNRCRGEFYDGCRTQMEQAGFAHGGECRGIMPDGTFTDWLLCCDGCPYRRREDGEQ